MTTVAVMLMCAAAEGFLLYVLTQFARELRKDRAVRAAAAAIPISRAAGYRMARVQEFRKVIEHGSRVPHHHGGQRLTS
jgi:hypothetical protein